MTRHGILGAALTVAFASTSLAAVAQDCPVQHTVVRGETLSILARRYYGSAQAYRRIYEANRRAIGADPSLVEIGTLLTIPCPPGVTGSNAADTGTGAAAVAPTPTPEPAAIQVPGPTPAVAPEQVATAGQDGTGDAAQLPEVPPEVPEGWQVLLGTEDFLALLRDARPLVLDVRPVRDGVATGYVPGSISMPVGIWFGRGASQLPADVTLSILLGENGILITRPIVIVAGARDVESLADAAWVYWLLRSVGAQQVAILEPGFAGLEAANAETRRAPRRLRARQTIVSLAGHWRADRADVDAIRDGSTEGALFRPDLEAMLAADTFAAPEGYALQESRAFAVLERLKAYRIAWEAEPVIAVGDDPRHAALAWYYASEVAGIRGVRLFPEPLPGQ